MIFIVTLVAAFAFLRWLIAPIPQSVPDEFNIPDPQRVRNNQTNDRVRNRRARPVTQSMIEVVQAIGPQLSPAQIRYSLEMSGSVEATVEEYMENGTLPYPPGETPRHHGRDINAEADAELHNVAPVGTLQNLLEKYGVDVSEPTQETIEETVEGKWGKDETERLQLLQKRREEMILRARRRMEKSLTNDVIGD